MEKKKLPHLVERNLVAFFIGLEPGDLFTYSFDLFDFREVKHLADERGIELEYMKPGTPEYDTYGCTTCRVVSRLSVEDLMVRNIKRYDEAKGIRRNFDGLTGKRLMVAHANISEGSHRGEPEELIAPKLDDLDPAEYLRRYEQWVDDTVLNGNTYYYAEPRESFNRAEAFAEAKRLKKQYVILEDLS